MTSLDHWILEGHETKAVDWAAYVKWMERGFEETRRVAKTTVGDVEVSTVFLSIDHNWGGGPPILFETMIFGGEQDEYQWRWHTWDEAQAGHDRIVAALKAGTAVPA